MRRIFLLVNLFFIPTFFCCPPNAIQGLTPDDCYVFSTSFPSNQQKLNYLSAFLACGEIGGVMTSITSAFETNFLLTQAKSLFKTGTFWAGAFKFLPILYSNLENPWTWMDYKNFTYTNWAIGQPNIYPDYLGCDIMFNMTLVNQTFLSIVVSVEDGTWFSVRYPNNITETHWFICRVPPVTETCTKFQQPSPLVPKNIRSLQKYVNIFCHYDVVLDNGGVFNISGNPCANGSLPSSLHSYEDATYYYGQAVLYAQEFVCIGKGQYANSRSHIGLRYNGSTWTWMDGSNLDYINWSSGYPKDPESFGKCAYFNMGSPNPNELINGPCYGAGSGSQDNMFCTYPSTSNKLN